MVRRMSAVAHVDRLAPLAVLDFHDSQSVKVPGPITPLLAWQRIMARPLPGLGLAFAIRDAISARFGVRRIGGFSGRSVDQVAVGDHLDFFLVEAISDCHMTLTARDRHLDVMICVTVDPEGPTLQRVTITASVVTHNAFGRLYMLPVAPAHRLIVRAMLRRLQAA